MHTPSLMVRESRGGVRVQEPCPERLGEIWPVRPVRVLLADGMEAVVFRQCVASAMRGRHGEEQLGRAPKLLDPLPEPLGASEDKVALAFEPRCHLSAMRRTRRLLEIP